MQETWVISACRTPIGKLGGVFAEVHVSDLGAKVIKESILRAGIAPSSVEEVIMGHALQAGTGQGATRVAAVKAGIPETSSAFSINNVCGSGLKSISLANSLISVEENDIIVAGGMENMSQAPFIVSNMRFGKKIGHVMMQDVIIKDGLTDSIENYHMGITAERLANIYNISRYQQDKYAVLSQNRLELSTKNKVFDNEIVTFGLSERKDIKICNVDENGRENVTLESISMLPPVFCKEGSVTAANSSSLADGAAAVVLASSRAVHSYGLSPIAKIVCCSTIGIEHKIMGMGAALAIKSVLKKANMKISDIDLFEINEAFSSQILAVKQELNIDISKLNISGGAIAMGHPIGASGARIFVTLINNLRRMHGRFGVASICVGGGMGIAVLIELCK